MNLFDLSGMQNNSTCFYLANKSQLRWRVQYLQLTWYNNGLKNLYLFALDLRLLWNVATEEVLNILFDLRVESIMFLIEWKVILYVFEHNIRKTFC